ncbi:MAG: HEAT repeat domain-containing protein [Chloroflexota bacterium]
MPKLRSRDRLYAVLLALVLAVAILTSAIMYRISNQPAAEFTPALTPLAFQVPGWEDVALSMLCLKVEQSYPQGRSPEPIAEAIGRALARSGVLVVGEGEGCDAALSVTLEGQALSAYYIPGGTCYSGAEVEGEMLIEASGHEPLTLPVSARHEPPDTIWGCEEDPSQAPFGSLWQDPLLDGLARLWGPRVLVAALGDERTGVHLGAVDRLGQMGPEVLPLLVEALKDEYWRVRAGAASAIASIGPAAKDAVPALIEALGDEHHWVREAAASALGSIGPEAKDAIQALIEALEDEDSEVRVAAASALVEIAPGAKDALPVLIEALQDEDWMVREHAAQTLGRMGLEAREAVPALIHLLQDETHWVATAAVEALRSISGEDFGTDAARWQEWWEAQE